MHEENECGIDWTLLFHFDSHLLSGTSSQRIETETEVEIGSAGSSASTSRASTPMQVGLESHQQYNETMCMDMDIEGTDSNDYEATGMLFAYTLNLSDANLFVDIDIDYS